MGGKMVGLVHVFITICAAICVATKILWVEGRV